MTITAQSHPLLSPLEDVSCMTWQRVAALGLLVGGAVAAAAFHNDVIAATFGRGGGRVRGQPGTGDPRPHSP